MNFGLGELLVILLFAFLIIGPDKLPQAGKTIGKAVGQFRDAQDKVNTTLKKEGLDPQSVQEMTQNPFLALQQLEKLDPDSKKTSDSTTEPDKPAEAQPKADEHPAAEAQFNVDSESNDKLAEEATTDKPAQEHEVIRLSDKETFTQRKVRLAKERESAKETAPETEETSEGGGEPR